MERITQKQLQFLVSIASDAGRAIMGVYMNSEFEVQLKGDHSPLTEADTLADKIIRCGLEKYFPNVFILSEESVSVGGGFVETFFLVDPLDGTKEFIKRNGEFTVNIALVHQGSVIASVVYAPALNEMFFSARGLGVWKESKEGRQSISVRKPTVGEPLRVIGSRSHGVERVEAWLANLNRNYEFYSAGSSLKFCRIAEGEIDIYPRLGPTCQWDTAAAQGVLEMAGGQVVDLNGRAITYGLDRDVLNPEFIAQGQVN